MSPQLRRLHFYFPPLHLQQKISFLLLTSLHGAVKRSAVALYSGVLMVRSLLTPSFWIPFAPVHAVHGPLWLLAIQRLYSKLVHERFSETYSNIHYSILSGTEIFYLFSFLSFSAHHNSYFWHHMKSKSNSNHSSLSSKNRLLHIVHDLIFFWHFFTFRTVIIILKFFAFDRNYVYILLKRKYQIILQLCKFWAFSKCWLVNQTKSFFQQSWGKRT